MLNNKHFIVDTQETKKKDSIWGIKLEFPWLKKTLGQK